MFSINDDISLFLSFYRSFALSLLDSCDERVMRTDVDDNKSSDQQNDDNDEIIKDMKYDFFSLLSYFFLFFLFSFSIYCFGGLRIVKKLHPLHPVTGTISIAFSFSLPFVNKANCVHVVCTWSDHSFSFSPNACI